MFYKALFFLILISAPFIKAQSNEDPISASASDSDEEDIVTDDSTAEEAEDKLNEDKIVTEILDNQQDQTEQSFIDGVPVGSKNVQTELLFTEPPYNKRSSGVGIELPANKPVKMLISFTNAETETNKDYKLDYVEGFLRYPSDYSYYLQNFTARSLDITVEPKREATVYYSFTPAQQLSGRPFGLTLRIGYRNNDGKMFTSTFFNDTVQVIEIEEGFDTESLFLYVLVAAVLGLVLFGIYHLFTVYALKKFKKSGVSKQVMELGTSNKADLDLQWIPAEHLKVRQSPTISPRKRKSRRHEDNHVTGH